MMIKKLKKFLTLLHYIKKKQLTLQALLFIDVVLRNNETVDWQPVVGIVIVKSN